MSRRVPVLEGQLCKRNYTWFRRNGLFFFIFFFTVLLVSAGESSTELVDALIQVESGETTRLWVTKPTGQGVWLSSDSSTPALMMSTAPTAQTIVPRTAVMIEFFRSRSTSSTSFMRPRRVLVASRRMKIEQGSGTAVRMGVGKSPAQRSTGSK